MLPRQCVQGNCFTCHQAATTLGQGCFTGNCTQVLSLEGHRSCSQPPQADPALQGVPTTWNIQYRWGECVVSSARIWDFCPREMDRKGVKELAKAQ